MARRSWTREIEPWFLRNGLPYFVEAERERARAALSPRRAVPWLLLVVVAAVGAAVALTWATGQGSYAPATLTLVGLVAAAVYGVTALRARPIVTWALRRTAGSTRHLVPMVTRALPLLLLFVTFLFINAEVWQLSAQLDGSVMWLTILLFAAVAVLFLAVRLPEEVDRVDDFVDSGLLLRATAGTPLQEPTAGLVAEQGEDLPLDRFDEVTGWERRNLILVLLVTQVSQVLLLSLSVFVFFMVFGGIVMEHGIQESWTGGASEVHALPYLSNLSVELVQVSVFLAAFSGLYFTVGVLTDETYRDQFFSAVLAEMERAVGVRAAYLAVSAHAGDAPATDKAADPATDPDGDPADQDANPDPGRVAVDRPPGAPAEPPAPASPDPEEVLAHWAFTQDRTDDIGSGSVTGELLLLADGGLLRRYGGATYRHGRTRWDFDDWRPFTGWQPERDEDRARVQLTRRGYRLLRPGPVPVQERTAGPLPGPPREPQPLDAGE